MKALRWIGVVVGLATLPGCSGGRLVPEDIAALMHSETGRLALKAVEGHGGIWRWRQRPYAQFDHMALATVRVVDTLIANRGKDTTITPRLDTLVNVRENCIFDLTKGKRFSRSASQSPTCMAGFNGDSVWSVTNGMPDSASARVLAGRQLDWAWFLFGLPFSLVDTTLKFSSLGEQSLVDTVITKGRESGTFDTTTTQFTLMRLKVEWPAGRAPVSWMVFYLDGRDGKVRRTLSPVVRPDGGLSQQLTVWTDLADALGLKVGGRRLSYPATSDGQITGPIEMDQRFYNVEFPRTLENAPFDWSPGRSEKIPAEAPAGAVSTS